MTEEQVIISVDLQAGGIEDKLDAITESMVELKQKQAELREEQKQYDLQLKSGKITQEEYIAISKDNAKAQKDLSLQLGTLQRQQTNLTAAVQTSQKTNEDYADSLDGMRAKLNDMQKAYATLTKAQRESIGGKEFLRAIVEQDKAVKGLEKSIGDARRNVGDYEGAIKNAFPSIGKFSDGIEKATAIMESLGTGGVQAMKGLVAGLGQATKAALKFIATPIGAVIAAIVAAVALMTAGFKKLQEAFKKNDEAGTAMARLFASFEPIVDAISRAFDKLASALGKVAGKIADWLAGTNDAIKAAQELVTATDNLEQAEREYTVNSAKRNKEISELRAKATQTEKYSAEERIAALNEAIELEKKNLEEQKNIAAEKLRILEQKAKKESDTSDETTNKIAQARAALYNAEEQYYSGTRRLLAQLNSAEKEIEKEREERMLKRMEEYYAEIRAQQEQMELLRQGLEALQDVEKSRTEQRDQILEKYKLKSEDDYFYEELENLKNYLDKRLITEEEYYKAVDELNKKYAIPEYEEEKEEVFIPSIATGDKSTEDKGIDEMAREMFGVDKELIEYYNELLESGMDKTKAFELVGKKAANNNRKNFADMAGVMAGVFNDMAEMLNKYGKENEKAQKAAKAFALAGILADQAKSISNTAISISEAVAGATKAANATGPAAPFTLPTFIATMVGLVLSQIASTASAFMQAKQLLSGADAGSFSDGGVVGGTSYTGDKLTARVNSDEVILNPKQASNVLYQMANSPVGVGFDYEAMAAAVAALPAPVMDYTEFKQFEQQVSTYQELANI